MSDESANRMPTIAVLGGTGKEGSGLAVRWALNGYKVIIGSRSAERAHERVVELNAEIGGDYLSGMENSEAAQAADLIVLSVPYSAHKSTIEDVKSHIAGKIMIDLTVPLNPPHVNTVFVPEGNAAALEAQSYLGNTATVVAAFQNVSATKLKDPKADVNCDVLICGDDVNAKGQVIELAKAAGMRGIDAGPLANAVAVEGLTPVLVHINKTYKVKGAGIRITNLD
jgi:NADPH-dependent F420 reductase